MKSYNLKYMLFCDWFLSFCIIFQRFIHAAACIKYFIPFYGRMNIPEYGWYTTFYLSVRPFGLFPLFSYHELCFYEHLCEPKSSIVLDILCRSWLILNAKQIWIPGINLTSPWCITLFLSYWILFSSILA